MPSPDMLDGLRAPRAVRLEEMQAKAALAGQPIAVDGFGATSTVYVSKYKRYRVQITAPMTSVNPMTGQPIPMGRELVAQFEDHVYRNNDAALTPDERALIDKTLQGNRYFGQFNTNAHFWLASEQKAAVEAAKLKSALDTMRSMPKEVVAQFVAELSQGEEVDHEMPPPPTAPSEAVPVRKKK